MLLTSVLQSLAQIVTQYVTPSDTIIVILYSYKEYLNIYIYIGGGCVTYSYIVSVSILFLDMNWQKIGIAAVPFLVSILISVIGMILAFRKWVAPPLVEALEEATKTAKTLASLGGIKKADWNDVQKIEKAVTGEIIMEKMPELQALRLILSPSTWDMIDEMVTENPAAVLQLYEKWAPYLGGAEQMQEKYMF